MSNYKPSSSYSQISRQEGYEKDIIISQLKSEIWELKQNERELSDIISHNKSIESQFQNLKDEKFRIENELKNRGQEQTKTLNNYRQRIDALEQQLTEKKVEVQELRAENIAHREHNDHKQLEISRLKTELVHFEDTLQRIQSESLALKNEVDALRDHNRKIVSDMETLIEANDNLQSKVLDQEKLLRQADYDKTQQDRFIESLNDSIRQLEGEVHNRSQTIKDLQSQVQESRQENNSIEREYQELEKSCDKLKQENQHNQACLKEEISKNFELNSSLLNLESTLRSKNSFIDELKRQLDEVKRDVQETLEQNDLLSSELDRIRRNYEITTTHNAELLRQLESFSDQDEEMRHILDRKSQLREIRLRVDNFMRQSQNDLRLASQSTNKHVANYTSSSSKHAQSNFPQGLGRRPSQSSANKFD